MRATTRLAPLAVAVALATSPTACSVAALQGGEYVGPKNTCNAGCGEASCVDDVCRAPKTNYKMMLEVTPPSNAHYASDVTFPIDLGSGTGGEHELRLDDLAQVTISIDAVGVPGVAARGVPLALHLMRVGAVPGLAGGAYDAHTHEDAPIVPGKGSVSIAVPPGDYKVYLTPLDPDTLAVLPPIDLALVKPTLGHFVSGPQEHVVVVSALKPFDLNITDELGLGPLTEAIDGYDVSVIDRATGRLVSTIDRTCTHPGSARVLLSPGLNQHTYSLRLSPPTEKCDPASDPPVRPTYDFDFDALSVDGTSVATIGMPRVSSLTGADGKNAPITVNVGGTVKNRDTFVKAGLVFRSRKLSIPTTWKTGSPFYEATTTTQVDVDGKSGGLVPVQLPAGQYDIQIVPSLTEPTSKGFAITVIERRDLTATNNTLTLSVASATRAQTTAVSQVLTTFDGGLVFETGTADFLSASGSAIPAGSLFAPLGRSRSIGLVKPTLVNPKNKDDDPADPWSWNPSIGIDLDPGIYDLVVRIPEPSGFAWIVAPGLQLDSSTIATDETIKYCKNKVCLAYDKGNFGLKAATPVTLTGKVVDPNGDPVARATVRARGLVFNGDPETTAAVRAVVVGETKSEEDGSYTLVVPSDFVTTKTSVR